jgi:dihydroorotate dehydrogenase
VYRLLRPLLFAADAEFIHHSALGILTRAARCRLAVKAISAAFELPDPRLVVERFGLRFPNPVGLAAGMDKDGLALTAWQALGFGFTEVGSVTALAQPGNPRPRLFRLPADRALVNRMGFNNRGATALARRLQAQRELGSLRTPLLVNVGKSRVASLERAEDDYRESLRLVWPYADAVAINVSSPNTPGLRSLQEPAALSRLLSVCEELQAGQRLPVLLKLSPDLSDEELESLVETAERHRVAGLIAVNTTLSREGLTRDPRQEGGLSGAPLGRRSLAVLRLLSNSSRLPIVSVGGVFDAADVIERLRAGASLVELYTGFVYGGPGTVRSILIGLLQHLKREGLSDVESLIGVDA